MIRSLRRIERKRAAVLVTRPESAKQRRRRPDPVAYAAALEVLG